MRFYRLGGALLLALIVVVTLVVSAPARILGLVLPANQVVMQGFAGSLWNGSASRVLLQLPAGSLHLGTVQWSLDPFSLLLFAPRLSLRSAWGNQTLTTEVIVRGPADIDVRNLDGQVSADLARQFAPVSIAGTLSVQLEQLQLREGLPVSGNGRLVWQNAAWQSPQGLMPLGTYALDFQQPPGEALLGEVITLSGPLQASGTVELAARHYELDILLSGEGNLDNQLRNMLALMAVPEGEDFRITLGGDF